MQQWIDLQAVDLTAAGLLPTNLKLADLHPIDLEQTEFL
jgi:hypothetical protein